MRPLRVACLILFLSSAARADEPPTALPPGYDAVYERCRTTGKVMVVWVNVKARVVVGAVGLEAQAFPGVTGAGIVVGVWKNGTLVRRELPATADDAAITAVYLGIREEATPASRSHPVFTRSAPGLICVGTT
ncbi:MAG TPA: hypothetical protein VKD90_05335 [Gemmataceae bacterium]|nr:hypothetical protein [Gemmataceae bacterium]